MSLLSKNSFFEEVDLNDSLEYIRQSLSSQKEEVFDDEDYFIDLDENYNSDESQYIIFFYFEFNKRKQFIIPISTESFNVNNIHVIDVIKYIIYKINNSNIIVKYNDDDYSISLKDLEDDDNEKEKMDFYNDNYEIKPYEFWNKNNSTSYCTSSLLSTINEENITLVSKKTLNVMLMKKL